MTPQQKTRLRQLAADAEAAAADARTAAAASAAASLDLDREQTDDLPMLAATARNAADRTSDAIERVAAELIKLAGAADPDRPRPLTGWGFCPSCGSDALDAESGQCHTCGYDPALPNRRPRVAAEAPAQ